MKTDRPRLPRNVWILGFVSLLMDLSSEIYHALLPVFVTVTLGLPAVALGAIDGLAEATASFAKLVSGRLSDRSTWRKPWVMAGYGLAALSKPLFPIAQGAVELMGARFADRVGKGIRGSPRDAMIADETPPEIRGRAFGLRQALDTTGALLAPIAAIFLMWLLANNIRAVYWIAIVPAFLSFLLAWLALREPEQRVANGKASPLLRGFREIDPATRRLLAVGFLFTLARFSESFLILKGVEIGLSETLSPLTLVLFNLAYTVLAYPAGSLSDRISPKSILMVGMAVLIGADLILAWTTGYVALSIGVLLWGAHMALTQGVFARMIADSAPEHLRATSFGAFWFVTGVASLLASLGAGLLWDREGPSATFLMGALAAAVALAMLSLLQDPDRRPAR
ncbi:MFS transporter [Sphingomonas sp. SM33]|uniref:MFS transporter n=1 Tax=Sphingomonas telluris TaxID=2907998 RepID=A0ABS9VI59_9SPHN|nr:MFS transporter [Sphingomonas telluris]MCH8614655.1 MFS transporter [Sphingomonas telluris]